MHSPHGHGCSGITKDGVFTQTYGVGNGHPYLIAGRESSVQRRGLAACRVHPSLSFATMSATVTATETANQNASGTISVQAEEDYKYKHLLPTFPKDEHYPPLTPFDHVDPGSRALSHPNPRSFLANAQVKQLTPPLGEEVRGVNLAKLSDYEKDQLALEVRSSLSGRSLGLADYVTSSGRSPQGCRVPRPEGLH